MFFRSRNLLLAGSGAAFVSLLAGCQREKQELRPRPAQVAVYGDAARESEIQPGGPQTQAAVNNPFYSNALAISEGQRLFSWYNCSGCHANGGGAGHASGNPTQNTESDFELAEPNQGN